MKQVQKSARTVEEAIQLALEELCVDRDEVRVDVVSEGRQGILGVGTEEATVRLEVIEAVSAKEDSESEGQEQKTEEQFDVIGITQEVLRRLLKGIGLEAAIAYKEQAIVQESPGRRILVTSDHGYVYFGSGCSFGWDNSTVAPMTAYFGGERFRRLDEKPDPPDHRGVQVLSDRGVAMIRGRVQTHPRGQGARRLYKHGGMSLMEMLVPWLVLEAS